MARKPDPPKRQSLITVPLRAHPLAKLVFGEMKVAGKTYLDMEWESGVLVTTIKAWRTHSRPGLETAEAALGALGWSLVPVPRMERLPEGLQSELDRLSNEWATKEPILHHLLATCCRAPFIVRTGRTDRELQKPKTRTIDVTPNKVTSKRKGRENPHQTYFFGEAK